MILFMHKLKQNSRVTSTFSCFQECGVPEISLLLPHKRLGFPGGGGGGGWVRGF